jgi:hypothetical protein
MTRTLTMMEHDHILAQCNAILDDRDFSPWSPVLAGWAMWAASASDIV